MSRMPEVGSVVDEVFRIEENLDEGNFGAIYRAHDLLEDRTLALKVHKPGPHDADELRKRFEREARLIYRLEHPNVVQVHYYGQTASGLPYMAMEHLKGTDLKSLIRAGYELSTGQINRIAQETLSALEAAHEMGIIHRDLKPANVFLVDDGGDGHVKVLDFGFAKALDDDGDGRESNLTSTETLVGSPAYMSPELVHKKGVGPVSDLYAMGLILGEMVIGKKLVDIENIYDTISFQASDKPVSIPPAVERSPFGKMVEKAVQKEPERRYQSAADMRRDLQRLSIAEEPAPSPDDAGSSAPTAHRTAPVGGDAQEVETEPESRGMPPRREVKNLRGRDPKRATGPTDATVVTDNPPIPMDGDRGPTDAPAAGETTVPDQEDPPEGALEERQSEDQRRDKASSKRTKTSSGTTNPPRGGSSARRRSATAEVEIDEETPAAPAPGRGGRPAPPVKPVEIVLGAALGIAILAGLALML